MAHKFEEIFFVPHAHLDLTWLGTPEECAARNTRIIGLALDLLRAHHDFRFSVETVRPLEAFLAAHPEQKQDVADLMRQARLEVGGTYADIACDYCFDEALARNIQYGQGFLIRELGLCTRIAREEDVLAHAAQQPQLFALSGIAYYKISRGPAGVFRWAAPDGSEVISALFEYNHAYHFHLARSYELTKRNLPDYLRWFAGEHSIAPRRLLIMDGDDGTDPNADLIEVVRAWNGRGRSPRLRMATATEYLDAVRGHALPRRRGDMPGFWGAVLLYESKAARQLHQAEACVLGAEKTAAAAWLAGNTPAPALHRAWRNLLAAQDHNWGGKDETRRGPEADRAKVRMLDAAIQESRAVRAAAVRTIAGRVAPSRPGPRMTVFNPVSWPRTDIVDAALPRALQGRAWRVVDAGGQIVPSRIFEAEQGGRILFTAHGVPPLGYSTYYLEQTADAAPAAAQPGKAPGVVENAFYRLELNARGTGLRQVLDKDLGKAVLGRPAASMMRWLGLDTPFPAMAALAARFTTPPQEFYEDVENLKKGKSAEGLEFLGKAWLPSRFRARHTRLAPGPVRTTLSIRGTFLDCDASYDMHLYDDIKRMDIQVSIDWRGRPGVFLVLLFPLPGGMKTVHVNTPYYVHRMGEEAKGFWKIPGLPVQPRMRGVQHWFSATGGGATVTCSSPWRFWDFSLMPAAPVLASDDCSGFFHGDTYLQKGVHTWSFSFTSAAGGRRDAQSHRRGVEPVYPLIPAFSVGKQAQGDWPEARSFCSVGADNVVVAAFKAAHEPGALFLRFYEVMGRAADAEFVFPFKVKKAWATDLLEKETKELPHRDNRVICALRPYEIGNMKIAPAHAGR